MEILIDDILPPIFKFRTDFGDTTELKASLEAIGQKYPILVRRLDKKWRVIDGQCRLICAKELGWEKINAIEDTALNDKTEFEAGLTCNVVRRDFNAVDEAHAYDAYIRKFGYGSGLELAKRVGISPSHISNRLRLIGLPEQILTYVKTRVITPSHGEALSRIHDSVKRQAIMEDILDIKLTATQTEKAASLVNTGLPPQDAVRTVVEFPGFLDHPHEPIKKFDLSRFTRQEIRLHISKCLLAVDAALKNIEKHELGEWVGTIRYPLSQLLIEAENLEGKWNGQTT